MPTIASKRRRCVVGAAALGVCFGAWDAVLIAQSLPPTPAVVWERTPEDNLDTLLSFPFGVAVAPRGDRIFVADMQLPGVVVLDASNGRVLQTIGRRGEGPGEFRVPQRVAMSPDGRLLAVYDVGRKVVELLTAEGRHLQTMPVGTFLSLKGMVVQNDSTVILAGGRVATGEYLVGTTWIRGGVVSGTGPVPEPDPAKEKYADLDRRLYLSGGPAMVRGREVAIADASTGDIWLATPSGARRIARGPGADIEALRAAFRTETGGDKPVNRVSFNYPQAVLLTAASPTEYHLLWAERDHQLGILYRIRPGQAPVEINRWTFSPYTAAGFSDGSVVVVEHKEGMWRIARLCLRPNARGACS